MSEKKDENDRSSGCMTTGTPSLGVNSIEYCVNFYKFCSRGSNRVTSIVFFNSSNSKVKFLLFNSKLPCT